MIKEQNMRILSFVHEAFNRLSIPFRTSYRLLFRFFWQMKSKQPMFWSNKETILEVDVKKLGARARFFSSKILASLSKCLASQNLFRYSQWSQLERWIFMWEASEYELDERITSEYYDRGIDEEIGASAYRRFDSRETLSWHLVTLPEQYSLLSPLGSIGARDWK